MRWVLSGEKFDVQEALRIGLVQEVVPKGSQLQRAVEIAQSISAQAPLGVQTALRSAMMAVREGEVAAAKKLVSDLVALLSSEDAAEGRQSFLERRPAIFSGR